MRGNEVQQLAGRVDTLMAEIEDGAVPAVAERVAELVRTLVQMYGAGLERIVDVVSEGDPVRRASALRRLADDPLLASLLVLHDLHPDDVTTRVTRALDGVRPYLGSHAGGVELLGVDADAVVHLRLQGSCDGCASSAETVRNAIEDAILAAAPDVVSVQVQGVVAEPPLLQIRPFRGGPEREPAADAGWQHLEADVSPRTMRRVATASELVLLANLDGTMVAYRDRCPGCGTALTDGELDGDVLTCGGCGRGYDVRLAGRATGAGSAHLDPLPLLPEGTGWRLALPARVAT